MTEQERARYKQEAAEYAIRAVQSGMIVGLGHGTTAHFAILALVELLQRGAVRDILGIPCSQLVEHEARALGIPLTTLEEHPQVDVTLDGADEVAPNLDVIKGHGGALLREKIVAQATRREIILIDESKLSPALGTLARVPVEVTPFGWRTHAQYLETLGAQWQLRLQADDQPFLTDERHYILDCQFGPLAAPDGLALQLQAHAGIVAHGLFLGLAHEVVVAGKQGVRVLRRTAQNAREE